MIIADTELCRWVYKYTVFTLRLLIFNWEAPAGLLESLCLEEFRTGVPVQASLQAANQQGWRRPQVAASWQNNLRFSHK
jgi:hypothetical protein